jgi:predicted Rossmann fold flavoprotein
MFDVIIVGGGAAGFYAAIHIAEKNPRLKVAIFERGKNVLSKVKISGGGRCNVTHAEFDPKELIRNYPRGEKELLGPFHKYGVADTMAFFNDHGVDLKVEEDGRVFPTTNSSQTILDCFESVVSNKNIKVLKNSAVKKFAFREAHKDWQVTTMNKHYYTKKLLLATGSSKRVWDLLEEMGHNIIAPVPSLFTFNIDDTRLRGLQGLSTEVSIEIPPKREYESKITIQLQSAVKNDPVLVSDGSLLITHWGLSGPAVLKLSAWGATILNEYHYNFRIKVNWVPDHTPGSMPQYLMEVKEVETKKTVMRAKAFDIPRRLWRSLVKAAGIPNDMKWADLNKELIQKLSNQLTASSFKVRGKSTFKEEFVTAGGVDLKQINFKTFESRLFPGLFFAGEVMNVDAITGGFNFQNAWTGAYIAAQAISDA